MFVSDRSVVSSISAQIFAPGNRLDNEGCSSDMPFGGHLASNLVQSNSRTTFCPAPLEGNVSKSYGEFGGFEPRQGVKFSSQKTGIQNAD